MFIWKGIVILLHFVLVPVLVGDVIVGKAGELYEKDSKIYYFIGLFFSWAVFFGVYEVCSMLHISFLLFTAIYLLILLGICLFSVWRLIHKRGEWKIRFLIEKRKRWNRYEITYLVLFIFLLGVQLYFAFSYESTIMSYDDYDYVVEAQDMISSNQLEVRNIFTGEAYGINTQRMLNSWIPYTAYLSIVSGFHLTTIVHTVLPVALLLVAYRVYYYMAQSLFDKKENQIVFLILLSMAYIFGYYSSYSMAFRLHATLWQGKAVLMVIVLPFLIIFLSKTYDIEFNMQKGLYLAVISAAACSCTMMGAGMLCIIYGSFFVIFTISRRKIAGWKETICGCIIPVVQMAVYFLLR